MQVPVPRLFVKYRDEIAPALKKSLDLRSIMEVPRLSKIVVNKGIGAAVTDKKLIDSGVEELSLIVGQRAVPTYAKVSISAFKLREGQAIGARVTLRRRRMYEFLDRLIAVALPRVRDFQGVKPKAFDGKGNYTLGVKEQIIFPEVSIEKMSRLSGMDISFVTTARTDTEGLALLSAFGFPFRKN